MKKLNCWKDVKLNELQRDAKSMTVMAVKTEKIVQIMQGQILNMCLNRRPAAKFRIGKRSTTIPLEGSRPEAVAGRSGFA